MRRFTYKTPVTLAGEVLFANYPFVMLPNNWQVGGRAIFLFGGHGGVANGWDDVGIPADHPRRWANAGYAVIAVPYQRACWGNPSISDATLGTFIETYNLLQPILGFQSVVDAVGYSMGGPGLLNSVKRSPSLFGRLLLISPALDLNFFENPSLTTGAAGYSFGYSGGGTITPGVYKTELDAAYRWQLTTVNSTPGGISGGVGSVTVTGPIAPLTANSGTFTLGGLTVTYAPPGGQTLGWQNVWTVGNNPLGVGTFYGVSTSAGSTVAAGTTFVPPSNLGTTWAGAVTGYTPYAEPSTYAGYKTLVIHPTDDQTVPNDMSVRMIAACGANWTLRTPAVTGGHTGGLAAVPTAETLAFFHARP